MSGGTVVGWVSEADDPEVERDVAGAVKYGVGNKCAVRDPHEMGKAGRRGPAHSLGPSRREGLR